MKKSLSTFVLILITLCSSFSQDVRPQYNVTYTYTGCTTIFDFISHSIPQNIIQSPSNPDRIYIVCMSAPFTDDNTFANRKTKYYNSTNRGLTWNFIGNIPDYRSGWSVISLSANGNVLISNHTNFGGGSVRTQWFYETMPGLGQFNNLYHPSMMDYTRPRTVTTNSLSLSNKFISISSADARDSTFITKCTSLGPMPGVFSPWSRFYSDALENYSIAKGEDGRIGIAYQNVGGYFQPGEDGSVYFMESTNHGESFGTPIEIFSANVSPAGDSLGNFRGIQLVYQGNVPKVVFEIRKLGGGQYFPNDRRSHIRFWTSSLPGSDPTRSIKLADTSNVGFHPYKYGLSTTDNFSCICKPTIGVSADKTGLFTAFIVPSDFSAGIVDTVSFMDVWFTHSTNNGLSWSQPTKINPANPRRDWTFPAMSEFNDNNSNFYYSNLLMLSDSIPGSYVDFTANGKSNAKFMFVRVEIPRTTGINNITSNTPGEYRLYQNYPNPFNPSTNIRYQITINSLITLKIFDVLGKEVASLVNEKQSPGTYEVTFDGSSLSSGIYFYKLETENFSDVKRMVLIK